LARPAQVKRHRARTERRPQAVAEADPLATSLLILSRALAAVRRLGVP
jgi:hypothetical protein